MRKRLLAWVLALAMAVTLLPMSVLAVDAPEEPVTSVSTDPASGVQIEKTVKTDSDGKTSLELSAYVTGKVETTSQPLDIVLVLDVSDSMDETYSSAQYTKTEKTSWSYKDIKTTSTTYYYEYDGWYYEVNAEKERWFGDDYYYLSAPYGIWGSSVRFSKNGKSPEATIYTGALYTKKAAEQTKLDALKTAVNGFIDSVAEDAKDSKVTHRISIVKFAGEKKETVGNDLDRNGYNYTQIVKNLTDVSKDKDSLKGAVNALTADGATRADYGLVKAKKALEGSTDGRQKVVIMFTDGEPTSGNRFESAVASAAVKTAKELKDSNVQVFTVGIFAKTTPSTDMTYFMNAVSSNYPQASYSKEKEGRKETWTWNLGEQKASTYYKDASNLDLSAVFQQIRHEMASVQVTSAAVLSDTLSEYFTLPEGTGESDITVKVQSAVADETTGALTWQQDVEDQSQLIVTVSDKKTISVTGFDYGKNPVMQKDDGTYTGKRVLVTIPFEPDTTYTDWEKGTNYYPTNDTADKKAGLVEGKDVSVLLDSSPEAPVTAYGVTYSWSGLPDGASLKAPSVSRAFITGQTYTIDTTYKKDSKTIVDDYTYTFSGWTVNGATEDDGVVTFTNADVTISGVWTKDEPTPPTEYNVTYEWSGLPDDGWDDTNRKPTLPNEGTYQAGASVTVDTTYTAGKTVTVSGTTYVFSGWTTPGGVTVTDGKFTMPAGDVKFTGQWTEQTADKGTLTVTKTFAGLTEDEVKGLNDFVITLSQGETTAYTLNLGDEGVVSTKSDAGEITYTWTIAEVPYGDYTVTESGEEVQGKLCTVQYAGLTKDGADNSAAFTFSDASSTLAVRNAYEVLPPVSDKGTLTITKEVYDGNFYDDVDDEQQEALAEAATGKTFTFHVQGVDENGEVIYDNDKVSIEYGNTEKNPNNTVTISDLAPGIYTVTETTYPLVLGFDGTSKLFQWSYVGTDYYTIAEPSSDDYEYAYLEQPTVTVDAGANTSLICVNVYDSWKNGIGKSATNLTKLNGAYTSDVTLTLTGQEFYIEENGDNVWLYSIPQGAYIVDYMGQDFDLVDISKMTVTITSLEDKDGEPLVIKATQDPQCENKGENHYDFVFDGVVMYEVTYYPATEDTAEHFVWVNAHDVISAGTKVEIDYSVKLTDPKTARGTYGEYDQYGQHDYKSLLTNDSAVLYIDDTYWIEGQEEQVTDTYVLATFPRPTVSYTVSGGSGGGSSRPTLNTEDHYGYIIGYPDGTVQPGGSITRAEVATIFFRMLTDSSRTEFWSQTNSFSDVPSTAWFNNAVSTLTKAGIIAGYEDGTFQPNATITRAEFATIAVRFFDATYDGKDFFTDIDGHWAQQYINDAANAGLVNGYEDGTFGPNKAITRAEAMTLVNRALDRHPDADHFLKDMVTWPDNSDTSAWYYEAVQEATNSHVYTMKTNTDKTKYENWTKMLSMRDWKALEATWSTAGSAGSSGEVMGK